MNNSKTTKEEIEEAFEEYKKLEDKRYRQFGIDVLTEKNKQLNNIAEEASSYVDKITKMLFKVIYKITGEPNRRCIQEEITIRDGSVYKYDDSREANISNLLEVRDTIIEEVSDCKNQKKLKKVFRKLEKKYVNINIIRYFSNSMPYYKSASFDHIKDKIFDVGDSNYISYKKPRVEIYDESSKKRAFNSSPCTSINFESVTSVKLINIDKVPVEEIDEALVQITHELEELKNYVENLHNHINRNFATLLVADKI